MIIPVCVLFSIVSCFYFKEKAYKTHIPHYIIIGIWLILIIIAGLRPSEMPDIRDYRIGYLSVTNYDLGRWEPGFWLIMNFLSSINADFIILLFLMATISIGIRLYAIEKLTHIFWGSMVIYLSNFFILHDMIQMRCAVASGLMLICVYFKIKKQLFRFILTSLIACLFHYSSILIFPIWFISSKRSQPNLFLWLIPISYIIVSILHFHSTSLFAQIPLVGPYISGYSVNFQQGEVNIFNALQLIRCTICILIWLNLKKMPKNDAFIILMKIYSLAICCLPLFSDIYVIAYRVSEFYLLSEIIVIPYLAYVFKPYIELGKLMVISIGVIFLFMNIFYMENLL